ncbi:hypothetical protein SGLAM104S_02217 [Streptomyces glaucescens]
MAVLAARSAVERSGVDLSAIDSHIHGSVYDLVDLAVEGAEGSPAR